MLLRISGIFRRQFHAFRQIECSRPERLVLEKNTSCRTAKAEATVVDAKPKSVHEVQIS